MAAEGDHIRRFNYTGADGQVIPRNATHITIAKSVTVILPDVFHGNRNIVEVVCDVNVKRVEEGAFTACSSLRRVIMPGVEIVERFAFTGCRALTDVECGKLEIIRDGAFSECTSLRSIDLPSANIVEEDAFYYCISLTDVKFGSELERIERMAFDQCPSLERITIPLKDGMLIADDIFTGCDNLKHVDLVEGELHETIAALQLEEWRNDMN
ncbi:leucine-rich repeat domain-containing protein, partial [Skeletonema marinoi]